MCSSDLLLPRPEVFAVGNIQCARESDILPLVDTLRRLLLDGVVQGLPMIVGTPGEDYLGDKAKTPFTLANLKAVLRPGRWNVRLGLYGPADLVSARRAILTRAPGAGP